MEKEFSVFGTNPVTVLIALLVAVVFFTLYMAIESFFRRKFQSEELKKRIRSEVTYDMGEGDEALLSMQKEMSPTAESLRSMLRMTGMNVETAADIIRPKFLHAGLSPIDGPIYHLFWQRIVSVILVLLSIPFFTTSKAGMGAVGDYFIGVVLVIIGVFGAKLYLQNNIDKRKKILSRSFPDALDLMLVCVGSGLALDASLAKVCAELGSAHPEITAEFNKTRLELSLLNDRSKALMNLSDRTDLLPFKSLCAALIQTEKFGTSLSDTLRVLSDDYRQTRLMMAENKANRLPALITLPLITLLLPAFMLIILGPAIIGIKNQGGIFGGAASK